jgi:hypothetical protein
MTLTNDVVGRVIQNGFAVRKSTTIEADMSQLVKDFAIWEDQLPLEMKYLRVEPETGPQFWANMLHMAYKYGQA